MAPRQSMTGICALVGLWFSLGLEARAAGVARQLSDEEVIASQRFFSTQWQKRFNERDYSYCGQALTDDAQLYLKFGPLATSVKASLGLPDPAVLHGPAAIEGFWNATGLVLGFRNLQAYDEAGDFASAALAVDDNTVILSSPFALTYGSGDTVTGQILSELWARVGLQWKLRSTMFELREKHLSRVVLGAAVEEPKPMLRTSLPAPAPPAAAAATTAAPVPAAAAPAPAAPATAPPAAEEAAAAAGSNLTGSEPGSGLDGTDVHGSSHMLWVAVLLGVGIAGFLWRRSKKRQEASISGFDAMLG